MFEGIKYRRQLRKLEQEYGGIEAEYKELGKGLSGNKLANHHSEAGSMIWPIQVEFDDMADSG